MIVLVVVLLLMRGLRDKRSCRVGDGSEQDSAIVRWYKVVSVERYLHREIACVSEMSESLCGRIFFLCLRSWRNKFSKQ